MLVPLARGGLHCQRSDARGPSGREGQMHGHCTPSCTSQRRQGARGRGWPPPWHGIPVRPAPRRGYPRAEPKIYSGEPH